MISDVSKRMEVQFVRYVACDSGVLQNGVTRSLGSLLFREYCSNHSWPFTAWLIEGESLRS